MILMTSQKVKKGYKSKRMLQHHTGAATFSMRKKQELILTKSKIRNRL